MNHKWQNDACVKCGLKREKKEYRKWQRCYTALSRSGVWEDRHVYTYGIGWHYGEPYGFERPQCALVAFSSDKNAQGSDTTKAK
jgi:hypothetical protein